MNFSNKTKVIFTLIIFLVFLIGVDFIYGKFFSGQSQKGFWFTSKSSDRNQKTGLKYVQPVLKDKKAYSSNSVPDFFPTVLIPPDSVMILKNEERLDEKSPEYILSYESQKSFEENKEYFQKFFNTNGWQMSKGIQEENRFIFIGSKHSDVLTVSLFKENKNKFVEINILYIKNFQQ